MSIPVLPSDSYDDYLSAGAIVGISLGTIGVLGVLVALAVFCCLRRRRARRSARSNAAILEEGNRASPDVPMTAISNPFTTPAPIAPTTSAHGYFPASHRASPGAATLGLHDAAASYSALPPKILEDAVGSDAHDRRGALPPLPIGADESHSTETASLPPAYDQRWPGIRTM